MALALFLPLLLQANPQRTEWLANDSEVASDEGWLATANALCVKYLAQIQHLSQECNVPEVGTTFSIYPPLTSDLPYLSVIITPGNRYHPLVTLFDTAAEAEAFNVEMSLELKAE